MAWRTTVRMKWNKRDDELNANPTSCTDFMERIREQAQVKLDYEFVPVHLLSTLEINIDVSIIVVA